jgi:magnesium transporter
MMNERDLDQLLSGQLRRDITPLKSGQRVGQALAFLRGQPLGERIVYFYVVDDEEHLVGVVPTRRLLMADLSTPIDELMVRNVRSLPTSATLRDASRMFLEHRLLALPVVDPEGRLHGVADVGMLAGELSEMAARQQADDIFQIIGARVTEAPTVWRGFVARFPWLLCNILGGLVAALIAGLYEGLLDAVIVLALFIPVVLAVSESVSMQSVTLTLQGLHGAKADWGFFRAALGRELGTALLLGAGCGGVVGGVVWGWKGTPRVAMAIAATVTLAMGTAALFGVALPVAFRAFRRDPRIAAGPIVLALTDFVALIFYFNIAGWLLR